MDWIYQLIEKELHKQDLKWGKNQKHTIEQWHLILSEEFGELSKELNEVVFRNKETKSAINEAIQTMAVICRLLENIK